MFDYIRGLTGIKMTKTEKKQDSRTALRLPHSYRQQIDKLVSEGNFKSLSHVVRAALTEFFEKQEVE
jgi:Arc/MetJ-type ribon-helix-helix transcriptional regulator